MAAHRLSTVGRSRLEPCDVFGKQAVQRIDQPRQIDRFAKQVQHLQAQQVADVIHLGVARHHDHRQVLAGGVFAQALDQRNTTFFRHAQVGDDQRNVGVFGQLLQRDLD